MVGNTQLKVIFAIVKVEKASKVLEKAQEAGAEGGTIFYGRGKVKHDKKEFLGIPLEPRKEIMMILIQEKYADQVLQTIRQEGKLDKPGTGLAFVMDVDQVVGLTPYGMDGSNMEEF